MVTHDVMPAASACDVWKQNRIAPIDHAIIRRGDRVVRVWFALLESIDLFRSLAVWYDTCFRLFIYCDWFLLSVSLLCKFQLYGLRSKTSLSSGCVLLENRVFVHLCQFDILCDRLCWFVCCRLRLCLLYGGSLEVPYA